MPKKKSVKKGNSKPRKKVSTRIQKPLINVEAGPKLEFGWAIAALVLNLILPGIGSIIGNRTKEGVWQVVLFFGGLLLTVIYIGIPMFIAGWIWALITGILILRDSM